MTVPIKVLIAHVGIKDLIARIKEKYTVNQPNRGQYFLWYGINLKIAYYVGFHDTKLQTTVQEYKHGSKLLQKMTMLRKILQEKYQYSLISSNLTYYIRAVFFLNI